MTVAVTVASTRLSCALRFFGKRRKCWQHLEGEFVINTVYRRRKARNSEISKLQREINSSLCHNICSAACRVGAFNGRHVVPPPDIIRCFCYLWHNRKTLIKCYGRLDRTIYYLLENKSECLKFSKTLSCNRTIFTNKHQTNIKYFYLFEPHKVWILEWPECGTCFLFCFFFKWGDKRSFLPKIIYLFYSLEIN